MEKYLTAAERALDKAIISEGSTELFEVQLSAATLEGGKRLEDVVELKLESEAGALPLSSTACRRR